MGEWWRQTTRPLTSFTAIRKAWRASLLLRKSPNLLHISSGTPVASTLLKIYNFRNIVLFIKRKASSFHFYFIWSRDIQSARGFDGDYSGVSYKSCGLLQGLNQKSWNSLGVKH